MLFPSCLPELGGRDSWTQGGKESVAASVAAAASWAESMLPFANLPASHWSWAALGLLFPFFLDFAVGYNDYPMAIHPKWWW